LIRILSLFRDSVFRNFGLWDSTLILWVMLFRVCVKFWMKHKRDPKISLWIPQYDLYLKKYIYIWYIKSWNTNIKYLRYLYFKEMQSFCSHFAQRFVTQHTFYFTGNHIDRWTNMLKNWVRLGLFSKLIIIKRILYNIDFPIKSK